jgi:hypothetical protein
LTTKYDQEIAMQVNDIKIGDSNIKNNSTDESGPFKHITKYYTLVGC